MTVVGSPDCSAEATAQTSWLFSEGEGALAQSPGQTGVSGSARWLPGRSGPDTQKEFP